MAKLFPVKLRFSQVALLACPLALTLASAPAAATDITLTMDEASDYLDGLVVSKGGVDFTFSDPTGFSYYYGGGGPGSITYVSDPSISGLGGSPFSVSFSKAVTAITFGFAQQSDAPLSGVNVLLSDNTSLYFDLNLVDPFAEGQFSWTGSGVTGFTVTPVDYYAVAFDNLKITVEDSAVPEPTTWAMMLVGFGLVGASMRRQSSTHPKVRFAF